MKSQYEYEYRSLQEPMTYNKDWTVLALESQRSIFGNGYYSDIG